MGCCCRYLPRCTQEMTVGVCLISAPTVVHVTRGLVRWHWTVFLTEGAGASPSRKGYSLARYV